MITPFTLSPSATKLIPVALEYRVKFEICASDTEQDRQRRLMNRMEGEKLLQQATELQGHSYARGGMFIIGAFYPDYRMQNHDSQLGQGYLESCESEQKSLRGKALIAASNQTSKCTYYFDQRTTAYNDFGVRVTVKDSDEDDSGGVVLHSQVCRELKHFDTKINLPRYLSLVCEDRFVPPPASVALN